MISLWGCFQGAKLLRKRGVLSRLRSGQLGRASEMRQWDYFQTGRESDEEWNFTCPLRHRRPRHIHGVQGSNSFPKSRLTPKFSFPASFLKGLAHKHTSTYGIWSYGSSVRGTAQQHLKAVGRKKQAWSLSFKRTYAHGYRLERPNRGTRMKESSRDN